MNTAAPLSPPRQSNMELLRIVAMLMVLVLHANFRALPVPGARQVAAAPVSAFLQFTVEGFAIVAVDVFVLLSGWFGIRFRALRLGELLFQVLFFGVFALACCAVWAPDDIKNDAVEHLLLLGVWDYWFVKAYIALYILSPVLNAFVKHATRREFLWVIAGFAAFQTIYGWWSDATEWFARGFSLITFMWLYLLGRYMRLYPCRLWTQSRWIDLGVYLAMSIALTLIMFCIKRNGLPGAKWYYYTCPLVIAGAMHLLLFFSKLRFTSRALNWVAVSAFAAFLTQSNHYLGKYYDKIILNWFNNLSRFEFILYTVAFIVAVFMASVLLDKLRLLGWNGAIGIADYIKRNQLKPQ